MTMDDAPLEPGGTEESLAAAACLLDAISDPARLRIVQHLLLGEHRVVELTAHLGLAQSTVSGHLSCLRGCGVIEARTEGRASLYRLSHPEQTADLLIGVERLLEATGAAATLCPVHRKHGHRNSATDVIVDGGVDHGAATTALRVRDEVAS